MAQSISLTSGSILNGNPITLAVTPTNIANASMHRIILEVECGMSGGNYEVIKLSSPVITEGKAQTIDISSALRTFRDSYEYTPDPTTYPLVKFNVKAYDEYMLDGEIHTPVDPIWFPQNPANLPADRRDEAYLRTIFGSFSDIERALSTISSKGVIRMSRKPSTLPQIVVAGDTFAYTPPFAEEQTLENSPALTPPQSKTVVIPKEGLQSLGYQSVYALPSKMLADRQTFRFINSYGVMESISVQRVAQKKRPFTVNEYVKSTQESFNNFSHGVVRKSPSSQTWRFFTDPLDEMWQEWYLDEFLMAENVWIAINEKWLMVHLIPEEEYIFEDADKNDILTIQFSVRFDINGSPLLR